MSATDLPSLEFLKETTYTLDIPRPCLESRIPYWVVGTSGNSCQGLLANGQLRRVCVHVDSGFLE